MKIGDNVFVHGYVDEIRTDTVIIRNNGGFFGTVPGEIVCGEMPERKKGTWIEYNYPGNEHVYCSECKEEYYDDDLLMGRNDYPNYCPNCGADMRQEGERDETD